MRIAVVGSGISGLSAAWLASQCHDVTLFEGEDRFGGHSHTVFVAMPDGQVAVDTGFIVYNENTYPNLTALFRHLDVTTAASNMSFAVSLDDGRLEYNGTDIPGLFAQRRNLASPKFWRMLRDLMRFYREAPAQLGKLGDISLGAFVDAGGYSATFRDEHLLPMAAAIWSAPARTLLDFPAEAFVRFCDNHGLLEATNRPIWRTVNGGSMSYVEKLRAASAASVARLRTPVRGITRQMDGAIVRTDDAEERFDAVIVASHADQALAMLGDASAEETELLGRFKYNRSEAVLHTDPRFMPRRRRAWASWNYFGRSGASEQARDLSVTYWMNNLQPLPTKQPIFLTLNPGQAIPAEHVLHRQHYEHPIFDVAAMRAQERLWSLQGRNRTWFCGAYFGAGFHEDGLQSGLAVAEELGGVRRPWSVAQDSARIRRTPRLVPEAAQS